MLPALVTSPIHRVPTAHGQSRNLAGQPAVVGHPPVFAPAHFRSVAPELKAGDVVMDSYLGPAHPAEETFGLVGAGAVPRVGFLVVDPGHDVAVMQFVKGSSLIGMDQTAAFDLAPHEGRSRRLAGDDGHRCPAGALAYHDNSLTLAGPVLRQPQITAVLLMIGRLAIAAEVGGVGLALGSLAAKKMPGLLGLQALLKSVQQHEGDPPSEGLCLQNSRQANSSLPLRPTCRPFQTGS
jgi:hypothetical protein